MRRLSELLPDATSGTPEHPAEYILKALMWLPPTSEVEAQIALETAARDAAAEGSRERRLAESDLRRGAWKLPRCQERDAIAATRPPGCWCLGVGGREPRYLRSGEPVYQELCECPEGQAAGVAQDEARAADARERRRDRAEHLLEEARIPARFARYTFETYPVCDGNRAGFEAVHRWATGPGAEAPDQQEKLSLLIHGPYGTGKTSLAVATLRHECDELDGGLFFTVPTLLDLIRSTYGPNPVIDERKLINDVKSAPFLVLDDLGAERVTEWVREKLFTIINHRHDENLPTVFTSNLDVVELGEHIGERTTWRIVEMCDVIHLEGPNLRSRP